MSPLASGFFHFSCITAMKASLYMKNSPTVVPVVWSVDGPVGQLGVEPLPKVQSKSSRPTDRFALGTFSHVQKLFSSKSQLPAEKKMVK